MSSLLTQLELALHDADCDWTDHNNQGHGDKYNKLAKVAAEVFLSDGEPYQLLDRKLIQRLHDADCDWLDHNDRNHGDKYQKLAQAAIVVFPPTREPYWLQDRKLIQETSLNILIQRMEDLKKQLDDLAEVINRIGTRMFGDF